MGFVGSYLWRLRQHVGSETVLMPGAMVLVEDEGGRLLFTRRADNGEWCFPAGSAEDGGSFGQTALDELREETGLTARSQHLVPFGCLSEADLHTIVYPNGDITHCFALLFRLRVYEGRPGVTDEVTEIGFYDSENPPQPLNEPARVVLNLYRRHLTSGAFQVR